MEEQAALISGNSDIPHQTSGSFGPQNFLHAQEAKAAQTEERQAKRRATLSGLLEAFPQGVSTAQAIDALKNSGITRGISDKVVRAQLKALGAESGGGVWRLPASSSTAEIAVNGTALH